LNGRVCDDGCVGFGKILYLFTVRKKSVVVLVGEVEEKRRECLKYVKGG
jgi:hypothetical protein